MNEWKDVSIGDLCETVSNTYRRKDQEVILVNTSDVLEGKILNHQPVANENLKGQFKKTFQKDDILYSEIRPANKRYAFVDFESTDHYIASTKLMVLRPKTENVTPRYLYAVLTSKEVIDEMQHLAETRSGTFPQITFSSELAPYHIKLPNLEIQKKIVSLLDAIEHKIETNVAINENLEQQAVVLFRSWFSAFSLSPNSPRVNSEFGEIPEDFTVIKVGSLPILVTDYVSNGSFASLKANVSLYQEPNYAYFIRNTDLKSGSFGVFVDQHSYEFLSKSTLYGGEIIISNVGDVGSVFLCPKLDAHMTLGNNIIMLRPEDDHLRYYLYIWFKYLQGQALIQGIKGGSAQPKFNKTDFKNTSILIPPKDILSRFHETVAPMFEMISHRQTETSRLANLRDTLLPHLMSGEIDVSKLDI